MTPGRDDSSPVSKHWRELLALLPGYDCFATAADGDWFDETAAQRIVDFFHECLTHIEGTLAGQPFILEPWQQAALGALFGWKQRDGYRRYRECFLYVPRKNGKTPLVAGIANYVLFCEDEQGQQNICAAGDREQASHLFRHVKGMIENEPLLDKRCTIYKGYGQKSVEAKRGYFKVISADASTKHGGNLHFVAIDELHAQPNRELVDALQTSTASKNRPQPLLVCITTADYQRESICNEKYERARKIQTGILEDRAFLPILYEADRDDDWTDPKVWHKANPNLDVSVSREYLERECEHAKDSPSYENTFKRLHLNIVTEQATRWLNMDAWDACASAINPDALTGRTCYGGLDLATTTDLASFAMVFPPDTDDGIYQVLCWSWCPKDTAAKRERSGEAPYLTWARKEHIELTPGNVIDYRYIRRRVNELGKLYNIREIGYDPYNAEYLCNQQLGDEDGFVTVPVRQGMLSMSPPTKELEKLILSKQISHGGDPVLRWAVSHLTVRTDAAGNLKPDKEHSTERIDPIVATIIALSRAMVQTEDPASVYEQRGLQFV